MATNDVEVGLEDLFSSPEARSGFKKAQSAKPQREYTGKPGELITRLKRVYKGRAKKTGPDGKGIPMVTFTFVLIDSAGQDDHIGETCQVLHYFAASEYNTLQEVHDRFSTDCQLLGIDVARCKTPKELNAKLDEAVKDAIPVKVRCGAKRNGGLWFNIVGVVPEEELDVPLDDVAAEEFTQDVVVDDEADDDIPSDDDDIPFEADDDIPSDDDDELKVGDIVLAKTAAMKKARKMKVISLDDEANEATLVYKGADKKARKCVVPYAELEYPED